MTLFQDVCRKFNISVPILGSDDGGAGAGTLSPAGNTTTNSSSAVPSPYVGSANGSYGLAQSAWTLSAGLVLLAIFGTLL
jgi:hypothetical protein